MVRRMRRIGGQKGFWSCRNLTHGATERTSSHWGNRGVNCRFDSPKFGFPASSGSQFYPQNPLRFCGFFVPAKNLSPMRAQSPPIRRPAPRPAAASSGRPVHTSSWRYQDHLPCDEGRHAPNRHRLFWRADTPHVPAPNYRAHPAREPAGAGSISTDRRAT